MIHGKTKTVIRRIASLTRSRLVHQQNVKHHRCDGTVRTGNYCSNCGERIRPQPYIFCLLSPLRWWDGRRFIAKRKPRIKVVFDQQMGESIYRLPIGTCAINVWNGEIDTQKLS